MNIQKFELFLYWIRERHNIWLKKEIEELPFPWSEDPIFQTWKFVNYDRNKDKVTKYLYENIWAKINDPEILLYNVILHRQFSKLETSQWLGIVKRHSDKKIDRLYDRGVTPSTGAFMRAIAKEHFMKGFRYTWKNRKIVHKIIENNSLKYAYNEIVKIPSIGGFMGFQIVADLSTTILKDAIDFNEFIVLGPGAKRGLELLGLDENIINIKILMDETNKSLKEYGLELNLFDIEHSLCEFTKYHKAKFDKKKLKEKYKIK